MACNDTHEADKLVLADDFIPGEGLTATEANLKAEWEVFRSKNPDVPEAELQQSFAEIQALSRMAHEHYGSRAKRVAHWADRRALGRAWLKHEIEETYHPRDVDDAFIQQALDAYAFESGSPSLVTASHVLVKPDKRTSAPQRREALAAVRRDILASGDFSDVALSRGALELMRAGYQVDMNANLSFPRQPIASFLGLHHAAMAVVEPFAEAAFALTAEAPLSDVVESEFGYHLILFKHRTPETKPSIEEMRDFMRQKIVERGRALGTQQALAELQSAAQIRVDEKAVTAAIKAGQ